MRVKITEERLRDFDFQTQHPYDLGAGDIVTVSEETGTRWCKLGWAEDVEGNVETGERKPGAQTLELNPDQEDANG